VGLKDRALAIMKRIFGRGYPEIYSALKDYAKSKGLKVEDVIAAAVTSYMAADEEAKEKLEEAITELKVKRSSSGMNYEQFLDMFSKMMDITVNAMVKVHQAGQELVKSSVINELKSTIETVEEIKRLGQEGGKGSIEDLISQIMIGSILKRLGASNIPLQKIGSKGRKTGKGKVINLEEEEFEES